MIRFDTVKPAKAAQVVAQQIREAIMNGSIGIGERLPPEKELIQQMGYSRAVVREALRLLEDGGLIRTQPGRNGGAVVCAPGTNRILLDIDTLLRMRKIGVEEVHEAQRLIEPLIVRLAIKKATAEDLASIRRTIELIEENPHDTELVHLQSGLFHTLLGEATHNRVVAIVAAVIRQIVFDLKYKGPPAEALLIARAHSRILDAIEAGDVETATRRVIRHIDASEAVLCSRTTEPAAET